jgi:hypothetical protein
LDPPAEVVLGALEGPLVGPADPPGATCNQDGVCFDDQPIAALRAIYRKSRQSKHWVLPEPVLASNLTMNETAALVMEVIRLAPGAKEPEEGDGDLVNALALVAPVCVRRAEKPAFPTHRMILGAGGAVGAHLLRVASRKEE